MNRTEEIKHEAAAEGRDPKTRHLLLALSTLAAISAIVAVWAGWSAWHSAHQDAQAGADLAAQVQAACDDNIPDTPQITRLCAQAKDVTEQVGPAGPQGDQGLPGPQGPPPSDAQVANAVALYCSSGRCEGPAGRSVTEAEVAQAVAIYCNNRGECRGPAGSDGTDGATGATGPQGPPPSDEQVLSAVQTYCSNHNDCQGPTGPAGPEGPKGETGVVDVKDNCDPAPDGDYISNVNSTYDADTKTITITCDYKPIIPVGGGG